MYREDILVSPCSSRRLWDLHLLRSPPCLLFLSDWLRFLRLDHSQTPRRRYSVCRWGAAWTLRRVWSFRRASALRLRLFAVWCPICLYTYAMLPRRLVCTPAIARARRGLDPGHRGSGRSCHYQALVMRSPGALRLACVPNCSDLEQRGFLPLGKEVRCVSDRFGMTCGILGLAGLSCHLSFADAYFGPNAGTRHAVVGSFPVF